MSSGCRVSAARRAKRRDLIIKMSSKTILIGLNIFRSSTSPCKEDVLRSLLLMTVNQNEHRGSIVNPFTMVYVIGHKMSSGCCVTAVRREKRRDLIIL